MHMNHLWHMIRVNLTIKQSSLSRFYILFILLISERDRTRPTKSPVLVVKRMVCYLINMLSFLFSCIHYYIAVE
jgi:hypothetical protein